MNIETLKSKIADIEMLVARWSSNGAPSTLEQELALEKIRALYDDILHIDSVAESQEESVDIIETFPEIDLDLGLTSETEQTKEQEIEPAAEEVGLDIVKEELIEQTKETEEVQEIVAAPETTHEPEITPEPEATQEPEPEATPEEKVAPEQTQASTIDTLFNIDAIPKRSRERRSVLYSLYEQNTPTTHAPKEQKEDIVKESTQSEVTTDNDEPTQQTLPIQGTIVAEMITPTQTIADRLAQQGEQVELVQDIMVQEGEINLATAFGVNDRFLIARDLFNGDTNACIDALNELNNQESLDDCIIHITESYNWNPHLQGSKLVMKLLERKFKERG